MKSDVSGRKKARESPYYKRYKWLVFQLFTLKELNNKLAHSLEKDTDRSMKRLKGKLGAEFTNFIKLMEDEKLDEQSVLADKNAKKIVRFLSNRVILPIQFTTFVRDMGLVFLIIEFESFLQDILKITFTKKPEILSTCKKSISFEELIKIRDIESAKQQIIDKETSDIVNQDIEEINRYFADKFNLEISKYVSFNETCGWKEFKERFYRRNILIHNSGIPNKLYREKTGSGTGKGSLTVSQKYLDESILLFGTMAEKLSTALSSKFAS